MIYDRKEIENDCTLASYNIQSWARLYLVLRLRLLKQARNESDLIKIIIKTLTRKTFWFDSNQNETIGALKSRIEDQESVPIVQQRLIYSGQQLENHRTLASYDTLHLATLHLVLKLM